jgi:hypothetical protein
MQCLTVLRQALDGLFVLDAVGFDERIERSLGGTAKPHFDGQASF